MSASPPFTPVGKSYRFDLGTLQIRYTFDSSDSATFVVESGGGLAPDGHTEHVAIELHEIRPGVFLNSWREATGSDRVAYRGLRQRQALLERHRRGPALPARRRHPGCLMTDNPEGGTLEERNTQIALTAMRELFAEKDSSAVDRYWASPTSSTIPPCPMGSRDSALSPHNLQGSRGPLLASRLRATW